MWFEEQNELEAGNGFDLILDETICASLRLRTAFCALKTSSKRADDSQKRNSVLNEVFKISPVDISIPTYLLIQTNIQLNKK